MIRRLCLVALLLGLPLKIGENKVNPINLEELILDPPKTEIVQNEVEEVSIDIDKIIYIESSGNTFAYNEESGARGLMQITPIVLEEWNNFHSSEQYTLDELFNPEINIKIGTWYLEDRIMDHYLPHYGIDQTIDNVIIAYNWGIGKLRDMHEEKSDFIPSKTRAYIRKYKEE